MTDPFTSSRHSYWPRSLILEFFVGTWLATNGIPSPFVLPHGLATVPKPDDVLAIANGPKFAEEYIPVYQRRRANPGDVLRFLREGTYFAHITNENSVSWGEWTEGTLLTTSNRIFTWKLGENVLLLKAAPNEMGYFVMTNSPVTGTAIKWPTPELHPWAHYEPLSPPEAHEVIFWKANTHGFAVDPQRDAAYFTNRTQFEAVLSAATVDTSFETWKTILRDPDRFQWGVLVTDKHKIIYWRTWQNRVVQLLTEDGRACVLKDADAATPK